MKVQIKNNDIVEHVLVFKDRESAINWCKKHECESRNIYDDKNNRLATFPHAQFVIDIRKFHSAKRI